IYDPQGKLTQQIKQNYVNGVDIYQNTYTFVGELLTMKRTNYYNNFKDSIIILTQYNYDPQGRKTSTVLTINKNAPVIIDSLQYNELGQLKTKKLHVNNTGVLESIDYKYNARNWLTEAVATNFSFKLSYNEIAVGLTPQYNGNISRQQWGEGVNVNNSYTYTYDKLNRLKQGIHSNNINNEKNIYYDKVGNILSLIRDKTTQNYIYEGNRLKTFNNGTQRAYTYNANGSMVKDGIVSIAYYENGMRLNV
ncbi:MAG: hypothetical protein ORN58_03965, partial [Sediminibacterium sp.]|nr:hypothetical protein [Sediminibacterium sp.]